MKSLSQDEHIYACRQSCTRRFMREDVYGGRVGANIREFGSSANTVLLNLIRSHLSFNTDITCNLLQE